MREFEFVPEGIGECSVTAWIHTYRGPDRHVDEQTPLAFIWHTATDTTVPVDGVEH